VKVESRTARLPKKIKKQQFISSPFYYGLLSTFYFLKRNMSFAFEKLIVYQKAIDFADKIAATTEQFPRGYGFLADQLNRASLSIATNIAEGNGRFTKADRKNFFMIARGSVQECTPLLELARRRNLIS
jgi:four helix bundle protein